VPDNDIGYYREAIADAKRRHGITSANDAPILEGTADPIGVPDFYLAGAIALPLIAFGVWALGIVGWRLRRKRRRVRAGST
jgi:hypothetical protein